MSLPELRHPGYTLEDWKMWDGRWELINGVAYDMTPAPSTNHQEASSNLHAAIWNALAEAKQKTGGGDCKVFAAPTDVYLDSGVMQPDLLVVCDARKISKRGIEGPPRSGGGNFESQHRGQRLVAQTLGVCGGGCAGIPDR